MLKDEPHRAIDFTVIKTIGEWFVVLPDKTQLGPYWSAAIALEVAVTHALLARRQGLDAQVLVRDDYGGIHKCMVLDGCGGPGRCVVCESSWPMSPRTLRCPICSDIHVA